MACMVSFVERLYTFRVRLSQLRTISKFEKGSGKEVLHDELYECHFYNQFCTSQYFDFNLLRPADISDQTV